ncbi:SMAD/FHA domain-containing protein, partial [Pterulicium gracile]
MPGAVSTPATNPTHFPLAALRRSSPSPPVQALPSASAGATTTTATPPPPPTHHLIRLVPQLESRHSLRFDPISRSLKPGDNPIRIGRFTDRSGLGLAALAAASQSSSKLAFRSKVVSRAHAELWVDAEGKFWIRDTKSSSGTFLNGVRLSVAGEESKEWCVRDGDMIQLGVDYQGGEEDVYKSVKMRVEVGREWQRGVNKFNSNAMKNLKALANTVAEAASETCATGRPTGKSLGLPDCCICLFPVSIRQALFLAPCSHTFHYKCIRPVIHSHWPGFCCPLCRTFADLEEEVE